MTKKKLEEIEPALPTDSSDQQEAAGKQKDAENFAKLVTRPSFNAAVLTQQYTMPSLADYQIPDLGEVARCAANQVGKVIAGDLSYAEAMLTGQAMSLAAIFGNLAEQAGKSENLARTEILMRMALKAQAQCTQTLRVLGEIKAPKSVSFIKQQNNAAGPQQVNNGPVTQGASPARAHESEEPVNPTNELLTDAREAQRATTLDTGAARSAGGEDRQMATVGTIDRPDDRRRQVDIVTERN